jgi:gliding motility-associated-like protein
MMNIYTGRLNFLKTNFALSLVAIFCSFFVNSETKAQRVYANQVTIGTNASDHVDNPTNAISSSEATFAQVNSYGGIALNIGKYSGQIELKFAATVPAGVTTYMRINANADLLKSLLGGSLGNLLASTVGSLVLGNHYFNVQARNGATTVLSGSSAAPFSSDNLRLVQDANGYYYLAITPAQAYDRVYLQDVTDAALVGANNNTQVYYAFYNSSASSNPCLQGFSTSFDGTGITLDLLQLGGAGVINAQRAIDADTTNYSQLSLGALGVAGSISQDIYFENLSVATDEFHIKLQPSPALLNVGLANNITITTYNGSTQVSSQALNTLLSVDLLGLLNNGQRITAIVTPGQPVNRIRVTFSSLLNANLTQVTRLYGAIRTAGKPTFAGTQSRNYTICTGSTAGLSATTTSGNEIRWYADSITTTRLLTTTSGGVYTTVPLSATTKYYVAAAKIGCADESERVSVTVTVKTIPVNPIVPAVQPICTGKTATFAVSNPEAGVTYSWYAAATGGTALGTGVSFITPALTDSTTFYVEGTNGTCTNAAGRTAVLVPVSKLPATVVPTPLTRQICAGSTTSFAIQNPVAGITYNWYDSSAAGNLVFTGENFVTPQLAANTNYYVEGVNNTGCASSSRTMVSVVVNPLPATPVLVTPVVTINPGGTASFAVSNPVAGVTYNWYSASTGGTLVTTGTTYTTPALNNTTNYYVEAVSSNGCVSSARATATVNVQNEVVCGYATTQQTINSGGVCLLCSVTDGGNSIDNDYTNFALVTATVGIGGYGQLLKFPNTYFAGDSISLVLEIPGQTIGAQLLGGISVQTYSGNNPNGDLITLDASPVKLQLLGGGTNKFRVTIPATRSFDGVAVTLSGISALSQVRIYTAQVFAPSPLLAPTALLVRASTQQSPIASGVLCALCSVTNPLLAVDADTTTYSSISATLGLLGGVGQLVQFPGSFSAGDSVQFDLEIPSQVIGAQLLNGIQLETYTNGTANGNAIQGSSSLVQLQLLGLAGNNKFRLKFAANHSFNGVLITINGVASVISNLRVYDAAVFYSSQNIVNICSGSSAVLTVATPQNADIKWYTTASGGTPVFTGSSYTTPPVTANTTYYVEASHYGCANPNRTMINIVPNTIPDNPTLNTNAISICQGDSAKLWATAPAGRLFKWYTVSSGGTPVYTGDTLRTGALNATTTYYVEALNNGCASNGRTSVVVTVNTAPANVAVTPASATIGAGQTASFTASSSSTNTTFNWYSQPTAGTPVFTGPAFVTPALTVSTTYYLEAVGASTCSITTRLVVPVTIVTGSGTPVPCDVATAQTSSVNGICIGCSVTAPSLAVDNDATTASELHVIAGLANAYVQQTLQFPFTGDAGDTVAVHVQLPVGLADVGLLSNVQMASYNGATYNNDRAAVMNNGPVTLQLLTGTEAVLKFAPTQSFDRVEVRVNSGLATLLSSLNIEYAQRIKASPAVTAVSATICQGSPATLLATGTPNTTFKWYTTATGGTPLFIGATYATPVLNDTTIYYVESVSATGCAAALRTPFTVNVIEAPAAPVLTNNPTTICSGSTAVLSVQSPPAGITYNWYTAATGGTTLFTGATYTTVPLTRDTVYYVQATSSAGGCTSGTRTAATVIVNTALPAPAVTSDSVAICTNSTATLSVQNPQTGITYNWYNVATGGTPVGTGASFTTPVVSSNTVYYVEAVGGSNCVSPRTAVKVTAAQPPAAPVLTVVPVGATINAGETATISASSVTTGVVFNWYLQSAGGTPVFTGPSFTTPSLTATTTYYVEAALTGTGCPSVTRTAVTVIVRPGVNLSCDAATAQSNSANGVCLLCDVTTPAGAVDTDTATFSTLNMRVGALGAFVEQTLIFPSVTAAGDTVSIALEGPASLLAADILGAIQVTSFNGVTSNNDAMLLNNGAVKIQLLGVGAAGKFLARFAPGAAFDRIQIRINSGIVAALSTLNVYYATRQVAPPAITTTQPVTICSGASATLTATASPNATIEWFTTATGGTAAGSGTTFNTGALTATTTYYVQAKRTTTNCANPNRVQVTVIVNPTPAAPSVVSNAVSICSGQTAVLQVANPQAGITYNWYNAAGTAAGTGVSITTAALTASTTYSVEAVNSTNCASATRTTVAVTVNPVPGARGIANNSTAICAGSTILTIQNPEAGVTYNWYNVATGGSVIFSGISFTTPVLTSNTIYYIEAVSASGCSTGTRTAATVTVNPVLGPPDVVSNSVGACSGNPVTLAVLNPQTGVTYNWYTTATGGVPVFTGASYPIASATASSTYYVEAASNAGCTSSSRTAVAVTVNPQPVIPVLASNSVAICAGSSATLAVQAPVSGITYRWYDAAIGGNLLFTGASYATPALSATTSYYIEASSGTGCTSSARAIATVTVNPIPAVPVITGGNVSVCAGSTVTLNVQNPQTGITYNWYTAAVGGTLAYTGTSFPTPALTTNTTYYVEAISTSGCGASVRAVVTINVNTIPAAPVITGGGSAVCSGTTVTLTVQNPQAGVTYNWYTAAASGTLLFTGTSVTTPPLTATTTYYVEAVNGSCASASRTQVTVTVSARPDNPVIAASGTTVCIGQSTTLTVQNPQSNLTYTWYNAGSGGTLLATGSSFTTPVLTASASYYVEVSNGTCATTTRTRVDVTAVQPPPAPVIAAGGTTVCAGNATTLNIQSPQTGYTYNWYDAPVGGNLLFTGTSYTTNVLNANTTFYVTAALNTGCSSSSRTSVTVTVNAAPAAPTVVAANVSGCAGSSVTLQVLNPASGATYNWYTVATGGTPVFTGPNYTVNNISVNTVYYVGAVSASGCGSLTRASVNLTVLAAPAAPSVANATPAVCSGSMVTLTASSTAAGAVFNWYATATGTTVIATGNSFTAGPITSDTTFYVAVVSTTGCANTVRGQTTVTLLRSLAAPVVTVDNTTSQSVTFKWAAVPGATGYQVTQDGGNTFVVPNGSNGLSHTISGLQPNQTVSIQVRALGAAACQTSPLSATVSGTAVNPLGNSIFIPNVFTPNNDGRNDFFTVFGNNIKGIEMWIFSQWGDMLFQTQNITGWNGMSGNKLQPVGVYIYVVKVTLQDGTILDRKGSVNLVR